MNLIKPALSLNTFTSGKIYFLTTLKQVIKISLYFDHLKSQIWHTNLMFIFFWHPVWFLFSCIFEYSLCNNSVIYIYRNEGGDILLRICILIMHGIFCYKWGRGGGRNTPKNLYTNYTWYILLEGEGGGVVMLKTSTQFDDRICNIQHLCQKLKLSNPYIFVTRWCKPVIF